ncbi:MULTISPECIES: DUF6392 family protein [Enterobacter cloacae complex]|jgi:hypothetical protein|uniref:DUF6392 family protein n=1 Tax=Enterobacter cloacae complex TaxID=354276 RepID=UPI000C998D5B|nr:DUF6392 family protein [Enterobacter cloacae]MBY5115881.1 DUF6392 family protein [Enterobacter cloacae]MCK1076102.1 DUF6392 family protein [Enterobacter cloacae subsp. cloacae]NBC63542.1 pyocin immunity protein [Enterobacter cloacae]PNC23903.1 pyocin immunity protein [Enterobacter cloacae]HAS1734669.1 pyocin immunity protein [Enterobacter cloacae]
MTINVNALIENLGKSYKELIGSELILYKSPPKGASGSPVLSLDMAKEGVFLSFWREGRILKALTLTIQEDGNADWVFPNALPKPLTKKMNRKWVHKNIGEPLRSTPPKVIMKRSFGWTDLYEAKGYVNPTSMQINYDVADSVRSVTFMPTSELRW